LCQALVCLLHRLDAVARGLKCGEGLKGHIRRRTSLNRRRAF
jgi:hypothetical protein